MTRSPFQTYTIRELKNALKLIDRKRYPDNFKAIGTEIARRQHANSSFASPTLSDDRPDESAYVDVLPENITAIHFRFTGTASEYFRIWIVNLLFSILTLGIYSAWAKVRTKRYFYANTYLDGHTFEYLGDPIRILKGRLCVAGALGALVLSSFLIIQMKILAFLAVLLIWPWVVKSYLHFIAANSAYRNIRFGFDATFIESLKVYSLGWLLLLLSLGLGMPWFPWLQHRFRITHSRYGSAPFRFISNDPWDDYLGAQVWAVFFTFIVTASLLFCIQIVGILLHESGLFEDDIATAPDFLPLINTGILLYAYIAYYVCSKAELTNSFFNNTRIGNHAFASTQRSMRLFWIYLSNLAGILISAGLLIPWAMIRLARYRAANLTLLAGSDLSEFSAAENRKLTAIGKETAELVDLDIGF